MVLKMDKSGCNFIGKNSIHPHESCTVILIKVKKRVHEGR